jgi:HSP20 family protein
VNFEQHSRINPLTNFMEDSSMSNTTNAIQTTCCSQPVAAAEPQPTRQRSEWSYTPAIDVYETPTAYVIECDAPGLKADGIDLTFEGGSLHLHGEVAQRVVGEVTFLRQEYGVGDFDREIPLGRISEFVDPNKAEAEYAHGVLTIRLPKLEAAQPRRIEVRKTSV